MPELSDEMIVAHVQSGHTDDFGELVERYEERLKRYARRFLSNRDEINGLVQDVFVKAYVNINSFNTSLKFSPWIYRIAHNTFVNELRRKHRYNAPFIDLDTVLPLFPARETSDHDTLEAELRETIDELLDTLPLKYREVIVLHYLEGLEYAEMSDILQIPINTVGVRLTRARERLRTAYRTKYETITPHHD